LLFVWLLTSHWKYEPETKVRNMMRRNNEKLSVFPRLSLLKFYMQIALYYMHWYLFWSKTEKVSSRLQIKNPEWGESESPDSRFLIMWRWRKYFFIIYDYEINDSRPSAFSLTFFYFLFLNCKGLERMDEIFKCVQNHRTQRKNGRYHRQEKMGMESEPESKLQLEL